MSINLEELMNYNARLGVKDAETGSSFRSALCVQEEAGEMAQALLDEDIVHARLECVDTSIASMGLFFGLGGTMEEYKKICLAQLDKWAKKYTK